MRTLQNSDLFLLVSDSLQKLSPLALSKMCDRRSISRIHWFSRSLTTIFAADQIPSYENESRLYVPLSLPCGLEFLMVRMLSGCSTPVAITPALETLASICLLSISSMPVCGSKIGHGSQSVGMLETEHSNFQLQ